MQLTPDQKTELSEMMRTRAHECYAEAVKDLEDALDCLKHPMGDGDVIEQNISAALINVGEARGFLNAASDVLEEVP